MDDTHIKKFCALAAQWCAEMDATKVTIVSESGTTLTMSYGLYRRLFGGDAC
jgi:hypothetical protein